MVNTQTFVNSWRQEYQSSFSYKRKKRRELITGSTMNVRKPKTRETSSGTDTEGIIVTRLTKGTKSQGMTMLESDNNTI